MSAAMFYPQIVSTRARVPSSSEALGLRTQRKTLDASTSQRELSQICSVKKGGGCGYQKDLDCTRVDLNGSREAHMKQARRLARAQQNRGIRCAPILHCFEIVIKTFRR